MAPSLISSLTSLATTSYFLRSIAKDLLPETIQDLIKFYHLKFLKLFSCQVTTVIDEFDGLCRNIVFQAVETYLGANASSSASRFRTGLKDDEKSFFVALEPHEPTEDTFSGVKFQWVLTTCRRSTSSVGAAKGGNKGHNYLVRSYELTYNGKYRNLVLDSYLPFILEQAQLLKRERKALRIFTIDYWGLHKNLKTAWIPANLDHPATFDNVAMDPELKRFVMEDLERFVKGEEYYRKIGKAWKRGYLLYGPPGTGKSSLIAAMANYLRFDVYDLELAELERDSDLRKVLIATPSKSILVIEDIDCTINLQGREGKNTKKSADEANKITLSGLLNFVDGLWSCCASERIIIFTTNHIKKLDPALIRPGRMDVHIQLSYCSPSVFRQIAANYLGIQDHVLFKDIEEALGRAQVTPAEVIEKLMKCRDNQNVFKDLLNFINEKTDVNLAKAGNGG